MTTRKSFYTIIVFFVIALLSSASTCAQGPYDTGTYYKDADGKKGAELKTALYSIINPHTNLGYNSLENYYPETDKTADGYMWDMYSVMHKWEYGKSHGGNSTEGAGWNKEHSVPQSWFNEQAIIKADIMHVIPTDCYVNSRRGNLPFGETKNADWSSYDNFSKVGDCDPALGYKGRIFEPNDEYKGDFARIYFYMATCYENSVYTWANNNSEAAHCFTKDKYNCFTDWFLQMLLRWAEEDPVSQKEINRNNAVYKCQGNRNPFVDYPQLEQYIWGNSTEKAFSYDNYDGPTPMLVPDVPYAADATGVSATGFTANWEYADNADSYTLELKEMSLTATEDKTVLKETFAKCDGDGNTPNDDCDKYMDNAGWTGSGLFPDKSRLRMASGSKSSALTSPLLQNPDGHVIVNFTESRYNSDETTISVQLTDAEGNILQTQTVTAADDKHKITFNNVNCDYKISFSTASKQRYYMRAIEIIAGGGAATTTREISGITELSYTFTDLDLTIYKYSYKVKGVNENASSAWSNVISINPTSGLEDINGSQNPRQTAAVYNLQGQKINLNDKSSLAAHGILIVNGRKYIR